MNLDRHLVGFSVREPGPAGPDIDPEEYYALLANAADFMVGRYDANVVFVPMEKTDVQHSYQVMGHMQHAVNAALLRRRYTPGQILYLMSRFDFAVGMRLHFLISRHTAGPRSWHCRTRRKSSVCWKISASKHPRSTASGSGT